MIYIDLQYFLLINSNLDPSVFCRDSLKALPDEAVTTKDVGIEVGLILVYCVLVNFKQEAEAA